MGGVGGSCGMLLTQTRCNVHAGHAGRPHLHCSIASNEREPQHPGVMAPEARKKDLLDLGDVSIGG